MEVYLLTYEDYDEYVVLGVYSTEELAEEALQQHKPKTQRPRLNILNYTLDKGQA